MLDRRRFLGAAAVGTAAFVASKEYRGQMLRQVEAQAAFGPNDAARDYGASALTRDPGRYVVTPLAEGRVFASNYKTAFRDEAGAVRAIHTRLNTGPNIVEAYVDLRQIPGKVPFFQGDVRAQGFLVDGRVVPQMDVAGGTVFSGVQNVTNFDARLRGHYRELLAKENVEQPGAVMLPVGFAVECPPLGPVPYAESPQAVALLHGADEWSSNPANWKETYKDPVTGTIAYELAIRPDGNHIRIKSMYGKMMEGWMGLQSHDDEVEFFRGRERAVGFLLDAAGSGFVGHEVLDVRGVTVWDLRQDQGVPATTLRTGYVNSHWERFVAKEAVLQPGAIMLPIGFKPGGDICPVDP